MLILTSDQGKPVFDELKVNGESVMRDLAIADAARVVSAFRAVKPKR